METAHTQSQKWYHLIDAIRGLSLLNMLLFHFYYDVNMIFGNNLRWYSQPLVHIWQQYICISFLFISGISWHFSKNNIKRGIQLNLYGLLITAVTLIFMPSQVVWFGILNCIGCATLLLELMHRIKKNIQLRAQRKNSTAALYGMTGLCTCLIMFLITRHINDGYLWLAGFKFLLPQGLYHFKPMTILGFPYPGFFSSDYFSILPWFFIFLAGYYFWEIVSQSNRLLYLFTNRIPFLSTIGKKTIWIYLLHQPLLYAAAYLLHPFL